MQYFINNISEFDNILRLVFFIFGLITFMALGLIFKHRNLNENNKIRLINNLLLGFANVILMKAIIPFSLSFFALSTEIHGYGLFNIIKINANWNIFINIILFIFSILILDFILYAQHFATHRVPFLWKLHRVHHTDIGFDTTTALRFHPIEILFSFFIKMMAIFVLGISSESIITFEIILNLSAMFNHSNFSLPTKLEKWFRYILVTPDMHRIHHSKISSETNSNYGFCLPIWDRMFKTYLKNPKDNPQKMDIGIETYRKIKDQMVLKLLIQPFLK